MGLRFRKSKKILPGVRLNISKKSASISLGGKGFRRTYSTSGRTTTSVGIPGSGLSYVSTDKKESTNKESKVVQEGHIQRKPFYKSKWFVVVIVLAVLAVIGAFMGNNAQTPAAIVFPFSVL